MNALGNGLLLDKLVEPEAVPDDLYPRFLDLVFSSTVHDRVKLPVAMVATPLSATGTACLLNATNAESMVRLASPDRAKAFNADRVKLPRRLASMGGTTHVSLGSGVPPAGCSGLLAQSWGLVSTGDGASNHAFSASASDAESR